MKKELKYYSRKELMDIIYQLKKSEERLKDENESLREQLEVQRIAAEKAVSVAESAMELGNFISSARSAAELYLEEHAQHRADAENAPGDTDFNADTVS